MSDPSDELRRIFESALTGKSTQTTSSKPCPWCDDLRVEVDCADGVTRSLPATSDDCNCEEECSSPVCEMGDYDD